MELYDSDLQVIAVRPLTQMCYEETLKWVDIVLFQINSV